MQIERYSFIFCNIGISSSMSKVNPHMDTVVNVHYLQAKSKKAVL
jgi:hypothetical protein